MKRSASLLLIVSVLGLTSAGPIFAHEGHDGEEQNPKGQNPQQGQPDGQGQGGKKQQDKHKGHKHGEKGEQGDGHKHQH